MSELELENSRVCVEFTCADEKIGETYIAKSNGAVIARATELSGFGATHLATEQDNGRRDQAVFHYGRHDESARQYEGKRLPPPPPPGPPAPTACFSAPTIAREDSGDVQRVVMQTAWDGGVSVRRVVSLGPTDAAAHVSVSLEVSEPQLLEYCVDRFTFSPGAPDFTWTQLLKFQEGHVVSDWAMKSPAAIAQRGEALLAIIPDVATFAETDTWKKCNTSLDLDVRPVSGAELSYGLSPSTPHLHSLFLHATGNRALLQPMTYTYSYFVLALVDAHQLQGHHRVVAFLWDRFGRPNFLAGHEAQSRMFAEWENETWRTYAGEKWRDLPGEGGPTGTIHCNAFFKDPDIDAFFCGWWNNMRTAYGMALYGRRAADETALDRSRRILALALSAPQKDGAFPVLFVVKDGIGTWKNDHDFGGYVDCYHAFDMSWTAYWLLKWAADIDKSNSDILPRCIALGEFLVAHQRADGFIPSYYTPGDLAPRRDTRLNEVSAEPAACALFLIELCRATGDDRWLSAAACALEYIAREIVPQRKWFDYETFLSCSPKPDHYFYDEITSQHPQNNMAPIMAAKAFLALHRLSHDPVDLERGIDVLAHLSLTQQVWSHPQMTPNLIGGFTTQNSDAEWSDARQAYCATTYLDYFEQTGEIEYLERGVAALRANFAIGRYENWAHLGWYDDPGSLSGFHWGTGSAMASVEMVWDCYGDVLVDYGGGWGVGVNGCTVAACDVSPAGVAIEIVTEIGRGSQLRMVFRNLPDGLAEAPLSINGRPIGSFGRDRLRAGVVFTA